MKNIRVFLSGIFQFLEVKFSIYLNRHVFVMQMRSKEVLKPGYNFLMIKDVCEKHTYKRIA